MKISKTALNRILKRTREKLAREGNPFAGFPVAPERNPDGTLKHIVKEGARYHVTHWDTDGAHCSEPNCEMNRKKQNVKRS